MLRFLLFLFIQALLYYVACHLLTRKTEHVPGIFRLFITVFLIMVVNWFFDKALGHGWLTQIIILIVDFIILRIGLGLGFIRTLIAALIVFLLNLALRNVFGELSPYSTYVCLGFIPFFGIIPSANQHLSS